MNRVGERVSSHITPATQPMMVGSVLSQPLPLHYFLSCLLQPVGFSIRKWNKEKGKNW